MRSSSALLLLTVASVYAAPFQAAIDAITDIASHFRKTLRTSHDTGFRLDYVYGPFKTTDDVDFDIHVHYDPDEQTLSAAHVYPPNSNVRIAGEEDNAYNLPAAVQQQALTHIRGVHDYQLKTVHKDVYDSVIASQALAEFKRHGYRPFIMDSNDDEILNFPSGNSIITTREPAIVEAQEEAFSLLPGSIQALRTHLKNQNNDRLFEWYFMDMKQHEELASKKREGKLGVTFYDPAGQKVDFMKAIQMRLTEEYINKLPDKEADESVVPLYLSLLQLDFILLLLSICILCTFCWIGCFGGGVLFGYFLSHSHGTLVAAKSNDYML